MVRLCEFVAESYQSVVTVGNVQEKFVLLEYTLSKYRELCFLGCVLSMIERRAQVGSFFRKEGDSGA